MAAIGKIRSWGPVLVAVIGLALFAFIAEELVRSCNSGKQAESRHIGSVLGETIDVEDYQKLVDEYQDVIKMTQGRDNLGEAELNQLKDQVWNQYVENKIYEKEAKALGLTVTEQELQSILKEGTNPMLMQTPFVNQQTGRFDANSLKQFLSEYDKMKTQNPQQAEQYQTVYNYWMFIEKNLRQQVLVQKYQTLLAHSLISNPVEAKMSFKDQNEEASIELAALPFSSVKESEAKVSDSDIKAKYDELKEAFRIFEELRDVKYVKVQVTASEADRKNIVADVTKSAAALDSVADPAEIVRNSSSLVSYLGLPQRKSAFPADIAQRLDSMAVGTTWGPVENKQDGTLNVVRLISKQQLPDSIQICRIQVGGMSTSEAETKTQADSIFNAIQGGADFAALAKKYNQGGDSVWVTSAQYENAPSIDKDSKTYLQAISTMATGEVRNIKLTSGNMIVKVVDRKAMTDKYLAAVIKREFTFSKDTRTATYNEFSTFAAESKNGLADMEKSAKKHNYVIEDQEKVSTTQHGIAGLASSREALKWVFSADEGDMSQIFECGQNRDTYLLVTLTKVHKKGYLSVDDPQVKEMCKAEALRDKQAEVLVKKLEGVKSIADAKKKGAQVSTVEQITFASPVTVQSIGAMEPALSGAVAGVKAGEFSSHPVKGYAGVYVFKVNKKANRPVKYEAKAAESQLRQRNLQYATYFMNVLKQNAGIKDNRYMFF